MKIKIKPENIFKIKDVCNIGPDYVINNHNGIFEFTEENIVDFIKNAQFIWWMEQIFKDDFIIKHKMINQEYKNKNESFLCDSRCYDDEGLNLKKEYKIIIDENYDEYCKQVSTFSMKLILEEIKTNKLNHLQNEYYFIE